MKVNQTKRGESMRKILIGITHMLFLIGVCLLIFFAYESPKPIRLSHIELIEVALIFSMGCGLVLLTWLIYVDHRKVINVAPQEMPSSINKELFGPFPYLFSLKPIQGKNLSQEHLVKLTAVRGKKFPQVFCTYFDSRLISIYVGLSLLLPILFVDQTPPSFLGFISGLVPAYVIFTAFLMVTWLSILTLMIFRIICKFKSQD